MPTSAKRKEYVLLLQYPDSAKPPSPAELKTIMRRFDAWMEGLAKQGRVAATNGLELTGKMLRGPIGETIVTTDPMPRGRKWWAVMCC